MDNDIVTLLTFRNHKLGEFTVNYADGYGAIVMYQGCADSHGVKYDPELDATAGLGIYGQHVRESQSDVAWFEDGMPCSGRERRLEWLGAARNILLHVLFGDDLAEGTYRYTAEKAT